MAANAAFYTTVLALTVLSCSTDVWAARVPSKSTDRITTRDFHALMSVDADVKKPATIMTVHHSKMPASKKDGGLVLPISMRADPANKDEEESVLGANTLGNNTLGNVLGEAAKKEKPRVKGEVGDMKCSVTRQMTSKDDKDHICPHECPLYAQDRTDTRHCTFICIPASDCAKWNPNKPIPDYELGACRAPRADHCKEYNLADATDTCQKCQSLYALGEDGQCHYQYFFLLYILLAVFILIVVFVVVWVADLLVRPETNEEGLKEAEAYRSRCKLRQGGEGRPLYPLTTNLTRENVAGPGMMLHFNFQAAIIFWAIFVASVWTIMALTIDSDLFVLGTRKFGSSRDNCILVAWGYETQQRLMWTKVTFLGIVYISSCILFLLYGVRQLRLFQRFDFEHKTSKDFVAMISGLPALSGKNKVEDDLKKAFGEFTNEPVVGVSVAWNFKHADDEVMGEIGKLMDADDHPSELHVDASDADMNPVRKQLFNFECTVFGADDEDEEPAAEHSKHIKDVLEDMHSSRFGFVAFKTESARDAAVEKSESMGGFDFQGSKLTLEVDDAEPDTVLWKNFDESSGWVKFGRLCVGFGAILAGLVFWTVVFYAPYAWSVFNFNYDNGQEPGFIYGLSFSMVVVVGNAIMYEICNRVSEGVGFKFGDQKESAYMILYTIACTFNIAMDGFTTYYTALYVMSGLDFRTYDGRRLADIDTFHKQFDTYAMQRSLAQNTYAYAFPSTYLIPFLIEPFATIYLPWKVGQLIVRSHPELLGRAAEELLACAPMELGRYADILLDMVLAVLIFYFPGGYTHTLFFAMAGCHIYIYIYDQFKVLRGIPTVTYASSEVDWWSQAMLAPICGMMLSCMVFKGNCQDYGYCIGGAKLVLVCTGVFVLHCIVHIALLKYVVPMFGRATDDAGFQPQTEHEKEEGITYQEHHSGTPNSFFSTNPVHCLRSKYIYAHSTPCCFSEPGREHLIKVNQSIGCYFDGATHAPKGSEEDEMSFEGLRRLSSEFSSVTLQNLGKK